MSEIATASIKTFASAPQSDPEQPSEEPIFLITASQFKDIIAQIVREATAPLKERISRLEANQSRPIHQPETPNQLENLRDKVTILEAENAALKSKLEGFEKWGERLAEDTASNARRINQIEHKTTTPTEPKGEVTSARIVKLKEICKSRSSGVTFREVERLLGIKPNQMTALVSQLDKRSFEVFTRSGDRRERVIRLKVRMVGN